MKRPLYPLASASGVFDDDLYVSSNPEVQDTLRNGVYTSAVDYFCLFGYFQLVTTTRSLHTLPYRVGGHRYDYDEEGYLRGNADVRAQIAKGRYQTGLEHFLAQGYREICEGQRRPSPDHEAASLLFDLPGGIRPGARPYACIFHHHDPDGVVDRTVVESVRHLEALGADVWFVTTTGRRETLSPILPYVARILVKRDAREDYGSWHLALREVTPEVFDAYELLLLVNDTAFFPVADPAPMFRTMRRRGTSYWSITDSYKTRYHLDRNFMVLDARAREVLLPEFLHRFEQNRYLNPASEFIEYEIGLTEYAMAQGVTTGAYCGCDELLALSLADGARFRKEDLADCDPSTHFWDRLITYLGCPTLRRDLLLHNPSHVHYVDHWYELIDPAFLPAETIQGYLDRVGDPKREAVSRFRRKDFVPRFREPIDGSRAASPTLSLIRLPAEKPSPERITAWAEHVALARHYGLVGFCVRIDPDAPPDPEWFDVLCDPALDMPFCLGFTSLPGREISAAWRSAGNHPSYLRVKGRPVAALLAADKRSLEGTKSLDHFFWAILGNGGEPEEVGRDDVVFERVLLDRRRAASAGQPSYADAMDRAAHQVVAWGRAGRVRSPGRVD